VLIELADIRESDLPVIKEIYDYYILNSTSSFFTERVSTDELKSFIRIGHPKYQSFMIKSEGQVYGFCYLSQFNKRQAYDRTAEISLYLKPEFTGKGIGREVIGRLEEIARENGISVLIAGITAENTQSIAVFKKCGFEECAHYRKVGEKFNRILDVLAFQKFIKPESP
jgi:phosphinothricin acetyltransferase